MLKLSVFGADYGESCVLAWRTARGPACAVVDCCWGRMRSDRHPIVRHVRDQLKCEEIECLIATHPHDDHISGIGLLLEAFRGHIGMFGWWGGQTMQFQYAYLSKIEECCRRLGIRKGINARNVQMILDGLIDGPKDIRDTMDGEPCPFYEAVTLDGIPLRLVAVSPWLGQSTIYQKQLLSNISTKGAALRFEANMNRTSLALVVEYGDARLILGGDAEKGNWAEAFARVAPAFGFPHIVKLPHHGSRTGLHDQMYSGSKAFVRSNRPATIAVTTRYVKGRNALPRKDVLRRIAAAGCDVWIVADRRVAGGKVGRALEAIGSVSQLSRFDVEIDAFGRAEVLPGKGDTRFRG